MEEDSKPEPEKNARASPSLLYPADGSHYPDADEDDPHVQEPPTAQSHKNHLEA